jgi:hypothetical protein
MSETNKSETGRAVREESKPSWLDLVHGQLASLRFGTVLITVHDGRVVQVEKNEKVRLDQTTSTPARTEQGG